MSFLLSSKLRRLSRFYNAYLAKALPELPLEYHTELILQLAYSPVLLTQKQLAEKLQVDKSRMAVLIETLASAGWLNVSKVAHDRRAHLISLTPAGVQLLPRIQQALDEVNYLMKRQLNVLQLQHFDEAIQQMEENLNVSIHD